jgi:histone H3/H4
VLEMKNITKNDLKHEMESTESELAEALIENIIKTKQTIVKSNGTEKLQNTSLDVLLLIDEFKTRFEKLGEKAKEIARKDGRIIVTYDDAEKALRQIRTEK